MEQVHSNIWSLHKLGNYVVVPTNGTIKATGECVMGRGVAAQAKALFPNLPKELGLQLLIYGNRVHLFNTYRVLTFPVKHNWWEKADPSLIVQSCIGLKSKVGHIPSSTCVYLPKVGCGNGGLTWSFVYPILDKYLNEDRFIIALND